MTRRVVNYIRFMSRWAPDAEPRLHAAALELFVEQGFTATTVPEIAARAGLTTRSFFRYYADKREVLFAGEDELPGVIEHIFADAGEELTALEVIRQGLLQAVAPRLEAMRGELLTRRSIVRTDEGLRERALRKLGIVHDAATAAFLSRGLSPLDAEIAGRLAVTIYDTALELWLDEERPLDTIVDEVMGALAAVTGPIRHSSDGPEPGR
jgi:AcrR family transcriptional regulator